MEPTGIGPIRAHSAQRDHGKCRKLSIEPFTQERLIRFLNRTWLNIFEQYLSEQCIPQDSIAQCVSSLRPQFSIREIPEPVELSEDVEQVPAPFHSDFTNSSSCSEATEKNRDIGVQPQCTDTGHAGARFLSM